VHNVFFFVEKNVFCFAGVKGFHKNIHSFVGLV
jgi:hypothetical protein